MKNLMGSAISFILVMLWSSTPTVGQKALNPNMQAYKDYSIETRDRSIAEGRNDSSHLYGFEKIYYRTKWYQLILLAEMEDYFLRKELTTCLYVYDDIFDKLPKELNKKMFDKKNMVAIQEFLKHYISFEKHETIIDIAAAGSLANLKNEKLKFEMQVISTAPGATLKATLKPGSLKISDIEFGLFGNNIFGIDILLVDFLPGTLDYFKD